MASMDVDDDVSIDADYNTRKVCDICQLIIEQTDNDVYGCDFCDSLLCQSCQDDEYITYYKCETCKIEYCYYDGPYSDHYCQSNQRSHIGCIDCGN